MSITLTLSNALSGLRVNQSALQITANNVANVNTEGYSRKTVETSSRILGGVGNGVQIEAISRSVNEFMLRELRGESSILAERSVRAEFYGRMQELFGNLASDNSMGARIEHLAQGMEKLSTDPESAANRINAVNAGASVARSLNDAAAGVQQMRAQADGEIAAAIDDINKQLEIIAELNLKIMTGRAAGESTGDLEDQRDNAINRVSEYMAVQYFDRADGAITLISRAGHELVGTQAVKLGYVTTASMSADRKYLPPGSPGYPGSIAGIIVNPSENDTPSTIAGRDLTMNLGSGKLKALVEMRDKTLPDMAAQYDQMAARLRDEVNAVHNKGVPYPGVMSIEGTAVLPQGGATSFAQADISGSFQLGTVDADGNVTRWKFNFADPAGPVGGADPNEINIGFAGAPPQVTVDDIVNAINSQPGIGVNAQVVGGRLQLTSTNGNPVILDDSLGSSIEVAGTSRGFSHFFGLNDYFTGGSQYTSYATDVVGTNARATTSGTLTFQTATGTFTASYTAGQRLDQVARQINAALSGQGVRAEVEQVTGGIRLVLKTEHGDGVLVSDDGALLQTLNMRPDVTDAARQIAVTPALVESPDRIARGRLQGDVATGFHIGSSDDTTARELSALFTKPLKFSGVGGLPGTETTLTGFGTSIVSFNSANAITAETELTYQESLYDNLEDKVLSFSGVNLDEEMSNMVMYQNAYQASARLVQAASDMYDILLGLGGR